MGGEYEGRGGIGPGQRVRGNCGNVFFGVIHSTYLPHHSGAPSQVSSALIVVSYYYHVLSTLMEAYSRAAYCATVREENGGILGRCY